MMCLSPRSIGSGEIQKMFKLFNYNQQLNKQHRTQRPALQNDWKCDCEPGTHVLPG